jgi:hypothetical protein
MSPKTTAYLGIIFSGLLVLALGGWLVKGAKALAGQKHQPTVRPRFA